MKKIYIIFSFFLFFSFYSISMMSPLEKTLHEKNLYNSIWGNQSMSISNRLPESKTIEKSNMLDCPKDIIYPAYHRKEEQEKNRGDEYTLYYTPILKEKKSTYTKSCIAISTVAIYLTVSLITCGITMFLVVKCRK